MGDALSSSGYSPSRWSQWVNDNMSINPRMKLALRQRMGLPEIPLPIADVSADFYADGTVLSIGDENPDTIIVLRGAEGARKALEVSCWRGAENGLTAPPEQPQGTPKAVRKPQKRTRTTISVPIALHECLNAAREKLGIGWVELLEKACEILESYDG